MPVAQGVDDVAGEPEALRAPFGARTETRRDEVIDQKLGSAIAADRSTRRGKDGDALAVAADDAEVQRAATEVEDQARTRSGLGGVRRPHRPRGETGVARDRQLPGRPKPGRRAP